MRGEKQHLYLARSSYCGGGRRGRDSGFLEGVRAGGKRTVCDRTFESSSPPLTLALLSNSAPCARPAPDGEREIVLSYSAIAAYRDCPRQYWYRQEQRLPVVHSTEAVHGVILHEVLRH